MLLKMKETMNEHKDASLSEIFKEKEKIEVRIRDFNIDCALDEGTQMNIMTESTWETLGRPTMVRSLGKIGLFKGQKVTLCYSCRRLGHLAKEFPDRRPNCICCKVMDHEVLDCPRMIAKL